MAFIRQQDYYVRISQMHLNQVLLQAQGIVGDPQVLSGAERTAITYIRGVLTQRFKVDKIFTDLLLFSPTTLYKWGDLIEFTADKYDATLIYMTGNMLLYTDGNVYVRNDTLAGYTLGVPPTNATFFTFIGPEALYYVTPPPTFDEDVTYEASTGTCVYNYEYYVRTANTDGYLVDGYRDTQQGGLYTQWADIGFFPSIVDTSLPNNGSDPYGNRMTPENRKYWTKIIDFTPYQFNGVWPNDTSKWTQGDNRNQFIIKAVVDLALLEVHGVINPNQVPKLRWDRAQEQKDWLKDCAAGNYTLECPFYTEDNQRGFAMRSGSNPPTTHSY